MSRDNLGGEYFSETVIGVTNFSIEPSLWHCSGEDTRGRTGEDISIAASGTDREWGVGLMVLLVVAVASSCGDTSPLRSMN